MRLSAARTISLFLRELPNAVGRSYRVWLRRFHERARFRKKKQNIGPQQTDIPISSKCRSTFGNFAKSYSLVNAHWQPDPVRTTNCIGKLSQNNETALLAESIISSSPWDTAAGVVQKQKIKTFKISFPLSSVMVVGNVAPLSWVTPPVPNTRRVMH